MVIRKFARKIIHGSNRAYDFNELIVKAEKYPRYKPYQFQFRGMKLEVPDFLSVAWQLKEIFLDEQLKFSTEKKDPVIFDCGSNVGISILYFKKLYPQCRILAFEPDVAIAGQLKRNLTSNNVKDISICEKAVWINDEGVSFSKDGADGGSVFGKNEMIKVPSIRLKNLLNEEKEIDFLKMDIEGAEVEVLKDCDSELSKVRCLFVEYHSWLHRPQQLDVLLNIFTKNGFRYVIHSLGDQHNNPFINPIGEKVMDNQLNIYGYKRQDV